MLPNLFFAPLPTVNKRPLTESCALLAMRKLIANGCTRWRCSFEGLSRDGGRASEPDFSCMDPLSISLDSIFKGGGGIEGRRVENSLFSYYSVISLCLQITPNNSVELPLLSVGGLFL